MKTLQFRIYEYCKLFLITQFQFQENIIVTNNPYQELEPLELWRHFAALNSIPRPSGREAAARTYVQQIADESGAPYSTDAGGNLVVRLPAQNVVNPNAPTIAIQSHLDMVCEKRPEVEHDFNSDPIQARREGDWIYATGTTLGADNGIGAAAALALLTSPGLKHGPLELIFTVEEETGLQGAMALEASTLQATMLINLDSEDPDEITIGCAGGADAMLHIPFEEDATLLASPGDELIGCEIVVSGLKGGHSGVQIHEPLGNAIKILAGVLRAAQDAGISLHLGALQGGSAHNAIPRDGVASFAIASGVLPMLEKALAQARQTLQLQWSQDEPNLLIELKFIPVPARIMSARMQQNVLKLLYELPHGVLQLSQVFPGKVQTSTNLAGVRSSEEFVAINTSSRSFVASDLKNVQQEIQDLGIAAGAQVEIGNGYPGWEPNASSRLLEMAQIAYAEVYGKPPSVEVIHAGLECGVIVSKKPGLEAISFGPLILGAHSPDERVAISTVEPTWKLLTTLLANLAR